jgi:uncharacterized surface protein with fasciclin (FAS1) repeats
LLAARANPLQNKGIRHHTRRDKQMRSIKKIAVAVAAVSALGMTAACSSSSNAGEQASSDHTSMNDSGGGSGSHSDAMAADLVGPGCAAYAKAVPSGAGSVQGMAQDPVAVAASNNPLLTTLVKAVSGKVNPKVDLVNTLNGGQFTVFAPTDAAFKKVPAKTLKALSKPANAAELPSVLTYHVVKGQMTPDEIAGKTLTTVEGDKLKVTGSGDHLKVQNANVVCGGVHTANATVYLIDSVLTPPSMM